MTPKQLDTIINLIEAGLESSGYEIRATLSNGVEWQGTHCWSKAHSMTYEVEVLMLNIEVGDGSYENVYLPLQNIVSIEGPFT